MAISPTTRNRWNDRDQIPFVDRCLQAVERSDVLITDEDVHEGLEAAVGIDQT